MTRKKTSSQVFEEIESNLKAEKKIIGMEKLAIQISLKNMTQEEKIQEASKPLYLRRYE